MRRPGFTFMAGATAALLLAAPASADSDRREARAPAPFMLAQGTIDTRSDPFSALVGKRRERRERQSRRRDVKRFIIATDNRVFLFENLGSEARLKFLCRDENDPRIDCMIDPLEPAEEIHVLSPTRGSRGDTIYKDAEGETLLRMASYGGATVFWPGELRGHAASKSYGDDDPLRLPSASVETAARRARAATAQLSAQTGAPIVFDIAEPMIEAQQDASVLADAVVRAAKGMARVADDPTGARIIASRLTGVRFEPGPAAELAISDGYLVVSYNPDGDLAGRPPSSAVARFLEESL